MELSISTDKSGFYSGFSKDAAITSKILIAALIAWAITVPETAARIVADVNGSLFAGLQNWYIYVVALFLIGCVVLALIPSTGRPKPGLEDDTPEFSSFSWFSVMFGADIGIGMLTFATAEPTYHFAKNPNINMGKSKAFAAENVKNAYLWSFLHWVFKAWASYAIVLQRLAYFYVLSQFAAEGSLRTHTAFFGESLSGAEGHIVDVVAVVATILCIAQTRGVRVEQFVSGLHRIGFGDRLVTAETINCRGISLADGDHGRVNDVGPFRG